MHNMELDFEHFSEPKTALRSMHFTFYSAGVPGRTPLSCLFKCAADDKCVATYAPAHGKCVLIDDINSTPYDYYLNLT